MSKRLVHKVVDEYGEPLLNTQILYSNDYCCICGKTIKMLVGYVNILQYNNIINMTSIERIAILNKYVPCLTEEEFIIKSIIE